MNERDTYRKAFWEGFWRGSFETASDWRCWVIAAGAALLVMLWRDGTI